MSINDKISKNQWSTLAKETFSKALELYGRNWKKIASMKCINKTIPETKRYATKYFNHLFENGLPLPSKVKETGESYSINIEQKPKMKKPNVFENKNSNKYCSKSKAGIAYSLPYNKEGFNTNNKAVKHLSPLWIRPSHVRTFNTHLETDNLSFRNLFRTIWFTDYEQLTRNSFTNDDEIKQDGKICSNIPICISTATDAQDYKHSFQKIDYQVLPEIYNALCLENIDKTSLIHRKSHLIYFNITNKNKNEIHSIIKRWRLVNGDLRQKIFDDNNG
eukprot:259326_1